MDQCIGKTDGVWMANVLVWEQIVVIGDIYLCLVVTNK